MLPQDRKTTKRCRHPHAMGVDTPNIEAINQHGENELVENYNGQYNSA